MELTGRVAVVTGAAHRVGRAIALGLARRGSRLVIHYHTSEAAAVETEQEAAGLGVQAVRVQADLRRPEDVVRLFETADRAFGGVDVLVNSAASLEAQDFMSLSADDWDHVLDLNLRGPFLCLQQAAQRMRARGGGAVVNISDIAAHWAWARYPAHSVSKAGLEMLTRVAALALAPSGGRPSGAPCPSSERARRRRSPRRSCSASRTTTSMERSSLSTVETTADDR